MKKTLIFPNARTLASRAMEIAEEGFRLQDAGICAQGPAILRDCRETPTGEPGRRKARAAR